LQHHKEQSADKEKSRASVKSQEALGARKTRADRREARLKEVGAEGIVAQSQKVANLEVKCGQVGPHRKVRLHLHGRTKAN